MPPALQPIALEQTAIFCGDVGCGTSASGGVILASDRIDAGLFQRLSDEVVARVALLPKPLWPISDHIDVAPDGPLGVSDQRCKFITRHVTNDKQVHIAVHTILTACS